MNLSLYKHWVMPVLETLQMSVNDASRIIIDHSTFLLQIAVSLSYDSRGIIYDCNMFRVQTKGETIIILTV